MKKTAKAATPAAEPKPPSVKERMEAIGEDEVISRIADGQSLREISELAGVGRSKVFEWLNETPERSARYACAREDAADAFDEQALAELRAADKDNIAVQREIASHFRWKAKTANPKRYGDKLGVDATVETKVVGDAELLAGLAKLGLTAKVNGPD